MPVTLIRYNKFMIRLCLLVIAVMGFAELPAHAYLDPGSGSMLIQVLLAGSAGLATLGRIAWRRFVTRIRSSETLDR
jgi:hypothetical protein